MYCLYFHFHDDFVDSFQTTRCMGAANILRLMSCRECNLAAIALATVLILANTYIEVWHICLL